MFAEVILNNNAKALNKIFDYIVPEEQIKNAHIGSRVFVPFGRSKTLEDGFIIGLKENSEFANKEIAKILDEDYISEDNINLAKLMSRKYFCNISDCLKLMLPPGTGSKNQADRVKDKTGNFIYLLKEPEEIKELIEDGSIKSEKQKRALNFLIQNDGIYSTDLEALADVSHSIIKTLEKNGYIEIVSNVIRRNPFINKNIERDEAKVLNEEQQICFDGISKDIDENRFSQNLVFGITGSRKNRNLFKIN